MSMDPDTQHDTEVADKVIELSRDQLEAECAAMREALAYFPAAIHADAASGQNVTQWNIAISLASKALSGSGGVDLLQRLHWHKAALEESQEREADLLARYGKAMELIEGQRLEIDTLKGDLAKAQAACREAWNAFENGKRKHHKDALSGKCILGCQACAVEKLRIVLNRAKLEKCCTSEIVKHYEAEVKKDNTL